MEVSQLDLGLNVIVILSPLLAGMLVSWTVVWMLKLAFGPKRRPRDFTTILVAMVTAGLGCALMWELLHGEMGRECLLASILVAFVSPGIWRITLAIVKGRWPRVYAALKVKHVSYKSNGNGDPEQLEDEDDTTVHITGPDRRRSRQPQERE